MAVCRKLCNSACRRGSESRAYEITHKSANRLFNSLIALRDALNANDMPALDAALASLRGATDGVLDARTTTGARQRNLAATIDRLSATETDLRSLLSFKEDVNLAEAIANLQQQENVYRAVLQSTRSVLQPSLFDFMR